MIGYKATYNGKCLNQLYEVGKTYTLDGELLMCARGFHFCKDLFDVFEYYHPDKDVKVFKVEALGNIKTEKDKSVTDKINILEEVNLNNLIIERYGIKRYFDDKGNYIKREDPDGTWFKYEYDSNGNRIKREDSYGSCIRYEYDENNKCIKEENSYGSWCKFEYDKNNNIIKTKYDKSNNIIKTEYGIG